MTSVFTARSLALLRNAATLLLVGLVVMACFSQREHALAVRNSGSDTLDEVVVRYDNGFVNRVGTLIPKAQDVHLAVIGPLPREATVAWTSSNGRRHEKTVRLSVKEPFEGDLVFTISDGGNVTVSTRPKPRFR